MAVVLATPGVASAASTSSAATTLRIRRIDASTPPGVTVDVQVLGGTATPSSFSAKENGHTVPVSAAPLGATNTPSATVIVVDTASSMNDSFKMSQTRSGLLSLIKSKPADQQVAIVAYGGTPRVEQQFTASSAVLSNAVQRLAIGGEPQLYAGVALASGLLEGVPTALNQVIIVGDGGDAGQGTSFTAAAGGLLGTNALTYTIGLHFGVTDVSALRSFASEGGQFFDATTNAGVTSAFGTIRQALTNQYEISYTSRAKSSPAAIVVSLGGVHASGQVVLGTSEVGAAVNPPGVHQRQAPGPLRGKVGLAFIGLLVLVAAALFVYAVVLLVTRDEQGLAGVLRPYARGHAAEGGGDEDDDGGGGGLVQTAIIQRAVDTTARIAEERGFLVTVEAKLEQANVALRPAEAIFFWLAGVVVLSLLAGALKGVLFGLIVFLVLLLLPPSILNFLAGQRLRKFNSELPDTLQLLASSLRAGFSFMQGVEAVAQEVRDPMGTELQRVIVESRLGRPLEEALEESAQRMRSPDYEWAVMAVGIQREVGGNLADLLDTVGKTMVERERLRRDVKSLTAEGRMSAIVLGVLPPGLGVFFYLANPSYMKVLFTDTGGQIALGISAVAMVLGFVWMRKIVSIDV